MLAFHQRELQGTRSQDQQHLILSRYGNADGQTSPQAQSKKCRGYLACKCSKTMTTLRCVPATPQLTIQGSWSIAKKNARTNAVKEAEGSARVREQQHGRWVRTVENASDGKGRARTRHTRSLPRTTFVRTNRTTNFKPEPENSSTSCIFTHQFKVKVEVCRIQKMPFNRSARAHCRQWIHRSDEEDRSRRTSLPKSPCGGRCNSSLVI